jgi:hypothetical protein
MCSCKASERALTGTIPFNGGTGGRASLSFLQNVGSELRASEAFLGKHMGSYNINKVYRPSGDGRRAVSFRKPVSFFRLVNFRKNLRRFCAPGACVLQNGLTYVS